LLPDGCQWDLLTAAMDINELGQITGVGLIGGQSRGYVLTPAGLNVIPEPSSVVLLLLGALALAHRRRRA